MVTQAYIVAGLGFGDEGKGTIVDALVRKTGATLVVRYNGGAQAGHNVVTPEGKHHVFSQYGAGTFAGARTFLSKYVMIDPSALANEGSLLASKVPYLPKTWVDTRAPLLTPWHRAINRINELARGEKRHGSCGMGIGALAEDIAEQRIVLTVGDLFSSPAHALQEKAEVVRFTKIAYATALAPQCVASNADELGRAWQLLHTPVASWIAYARRMFDEERAWPGRFHDAVVESGGGPVIFEGAQGVLLDQTHGFAPHNTWSDCTYNNAFALLNYSGLSFDVVKSIGVLRAFHTRHGAGPLPTEKPHRSPAMPSEWQRGEHNQEGPWQGAFRYGFFDAVLARYALAKSVKTDMLALTCLDRVPSGEFIYCDSYHDGRDGSVARDVGWLNENAYTAADLERFTALLTRVGISARSAIEAELGIPAGVVSYGPTWKDKTWLRM